MTIKHPLTYFLRRSLRHQRKKWRSDKIRMQRWQLVPIISLLSNFELKIMLDVAVKPFGNAEVAYVMNTLFILIFFVFRNC